MSENRDTRAIFIASHYADEFAFKHVAPYVSAKSAKFQFGFLSSKPCPFPLESSLEFVIHRGKPG